MRAISVVTMPAMAGAMAALLSAASPAASPRAQSHPCRSQLGETVACADSPSVAVTRPLPAGDAPAFLFAAVQPITPPDGWRAVYHEVERCAAARGDYDQVRWAVMEAPLQGPKGPTYGFNIGSRIVLVRQDTTYLRHEMLHHILQVAGWQPPALEPGDEYTIADLHPTELFGRCARA